MFCLFVPFFIFIIETARFLDSSQVKKLKNINKKKRYCMNKMSKVDQIIIPGLSIVFTFFYFGYAIVIYYRS